MANLTRNFLSGRMNKIVDERLLPEGEYINAMNIRMGSTENAEVGVVTNTKGNINLTSLSYIDGTLLSVNARCIGAVEDSANETIFWFVHDPSFTTTSLGPNITGILDLVVSYNVLTNILKYHIVSINDGSNVTSVLNFNKTYLITGVNLIDDLLFWTDNYNPPRFINIKRNYPNPVLDLDVLNPEAILVIKKPPTESPTVQLITTSGQENYLETRFICFAYRYKYIDGEYSATSQWSDIAFTPKPFQFNKNSMLNEGMVNFYNAAIINYNSGGPLVVGIDLLFKESNKNIIKIIEKLDKANDLGGVNNQVLQYSFNNSKIFTVLNETEILRLYDNVPLLSKAQTIMGNRLMYGNYIDGYNLIDKNGFPVKFEYIPYLISKIIGEKSIPDSIGNGSYNIDPSATGQVINSSITTINLSGITLLAGSSITINMTIIHSAFTGNPPFPVETTSYIDLDFIFNLSTNYSSVYELATSLEFQQAVGTAANIKPVYSATPGAETSCDGTTLTDQLNCLLPNNLDALTKYGSGINAILEPIKIITSPASDVIGFQISAMEYVNSLTAPTQRVYEYYNFIFTKAVFKEISNSSSLHSNRGYEVGIVYMDEFNRSTTALVSLNNTVFVPCGNSTSKNSIQVTIPTLQRAPVWAKRYKFVIKPDAENFETIYSSIFFTDPGNNDVWFLLEGENMRKVESGDRLIVKSDTSGPTTSCAYTTILEKKAQPYNFITPKENVSALAGLYIKLNPNSFDIKVDPLAIISPGLAYPLVYAGIGDHSCPQGQYPMNIPGTDPNNPGWTWVDYTIPAGSRIRIYINANRLGTGSSCEANIAILDAEYGSSRDYDNMYDWFNGENISATLQNPSISQAGGATIQYVPGLGYPGCAFNTVYLQFNRDTGNNRLWMNVSTGWACTGASADSRRFFIDMQLIVYRALTTIVWETQPSDALPDVFFENNLSFPIDIDGNHMGNVTNQDIANGIDGVVDTGFFNCFSFGNGAESYKIRDSIIGRPFNLGERVTTVSEQEYKEANRFSDITYSGIFNGESNVNKLNQFNSGLSNFKHCEASFGPIMLLDGRNTDVFVLQEDKISYVLAEKNLLSDASAGGIITASPEVLGTQMARTEKYGISFNPESYVQWGFDRYFADAKRGAVIQLRGGDSGNEKLIAISEQSMRTWFRDTFSSSFNFQKLGAFDPYMNEYVLSTNDEMLPINPSCISCGVSQTFTLLIAEEESKEFVYCVDLGPLVGYSQIEWIFTNIESGATLDVSVDYNGTIDSSGPINSNGILAFNKNELIVETAEITLTYTGDMVVSVIANCCLPEPMTIIEVVLTNNSEAGDTIHNQYRYTNGIFVGPLFSNLVLFANGTSSPLVSRYNSVSGFVGSGGFPPEGSSMRLSINKISPDNFVFDILQDKFKYHRSSILYSNNDIDMQSLLLASTLITPNLGADPLYYGDFIVPLSTNGEYLYLIWDLRDAILAELCFAENVIDACCDCTLDEYYLNASFSTATSVYIDINLSTFANNGFYSFGGIVRELVDGILLPQQTCAPCSVEVSLCFGVSAIDVCCNCDESCPLPYNTYIVTNNSSTSQLIGYYNENGIYQEITLNSSGVNYICSIGAPTCSSVEVDIVYYYCGCGV